MSSPWLPHLPCRDALGSINCDGCCSEHKEETSALPRGEGAALGPFGGEARARFGGPVPLPRASPPLRSCPGGLRGPPRESDGKEMEAVQQSRKSSTVSALSAIRSKVPPEAPARSRGRLLSGRARRNASSYCGRRIGSPALSNKEEFL
jgi:hypothetical protein